MRRRFINGKGECLSIRALEDTTITVQVIGGGNLFAQINNGAWGNITSDPIGLSAGDVIKYKGTIKESHNSSMTGRGVVFSISNKVELFGDCTSIFEKRELFRYALNGAFSGAPIIRVSADFLPATTLAHMCYNQMFYNCTSLTTAPELPATILDTECYSEMFGGCTSLTTAPSILPATTLASRCYKSMFSNCTSLTTAPELPATTLARECYGSMFYGCSKLNYIKAMFTTTPSSTYTSGWVSGVASSGTFVKNKNASWNVVGANGIPSGWTVKTE